MTEADYGVLVNNKFSLFVDEENEPDAIIAQLQPPALAQKDAKKKDDLKKKKPPVVPSSMKQQPPDKKVTAQVNQKPTTGKVPVADTKNHLQKDGKENKDATKVAFGQEGQRGGGQKRTPRPPRFGGENGRDENNQPGADNQGFGGRGRGRGGGFGYGGGPRRGQQFRGPNAGEEGTDQIGGEQNGNVNTGFQTDVVQRGGDEFGGADDGGFRGYRNLRGGRGAGAGVNFGYARGGRLANFAGHGRQYDRQSGSAKTGVKSVEKRDGGGAHNWGTPEDELIGQNEGFNVTAQSVDEVQGDAATEQVEKEGDEKPSGNVDVKEEEDEAAKQLTFDEWKAMQQQKDKPSFNIRKAGEGDSDKAEWNKMKLKVLKRDEGQKNKKNKDKDEGYEEDEHDEESFQKKKPLESIIKINFVDDQKGYGRGGRGGGRGFSRGGSGFSDRGGQRGGFGGGYSSGQGQSNGNVPRSFGGGRGQRDTPYKMDEESFPQLGAAQ